MKKNKMCMVFIICIFTVLSLYTSVFADTLGKTTVNVDIKVPDGYSDSIIIGMATKDLNKMFTLECNKNNNYKGSFQVDKNNIYNITFTGDTIEKYNISSSLGDNTKMLNANKDSINLNLYMASKNSEDSTNKVAKDKKNSVDTEHSMDSSTDESNQVLKAYLNATTNILNKKEYEQFLALYSYKVYEEEFLSSDTNNTTDEWDNMSNVDKFNYHITYGYPKTLINGVNSSILSDTKEHYLDNIIEKNKLLKLKDGDKVYNAIVNVWTWQYENKATGKPLINFYEKPTKDISDSLATTNNPSTTSSEGPLVIAPHNTPSPTLTASTTNIDTSKKNSNINEIKSGKSLLNAIRASIISIILLLFVSGGFVYFYIKRKKNSK